MISMDEILKGRARLEDLPKDVQDNLAALLSRINKVRQAYGKPMKVNDGLRRPEDQPKNSATKSKHLIGAAIDIDDDDSLFMWNWVKDNLQLMKDVGLWLEDPRWTHGSVGTWVHFQILPPTSGKRIFVPSMTPASAPDIWDGKYDHKYD
jgi:hypothetical protein